MSVRGLFVSEKTCLQSDTPHEWYSSSFYFIASKLCISWWCHCVKLWTALICFIDLMDQLNCLIIAADISTQHLNATNCKKYQLWDRNTTRYKGFHFLKMSWDFLVQFLFTIKVCCMQYCNRNCCKLLLLSPSMLSLAVMVTMDDGSIITG